jgi:iron complex transport system ATP-binding protein
MSMLEIRDADFSYGTFKALSNISLAIEKGGFYGLMGPNGSGKSTLLHLLSGIFKPQRGEITVQGRPLMEINKRERARLLAFVPQDFQVDFPFTCREVVMMGRFAHQGLLGLESPEDERLVEESMKTTRTDGLAHRPITQLSGGEAQRVMLAQALAQGGELLLLDEPTSHLDIKFQVEIMELLKKLNEEKGLTIISSLHDLNLASHYCHHLFFIHDGRVSESGPVREIFTEEVISRVFGIEAKIITHPYSLKPMMVLRGEYVMQAVEREQGD